MYKAGRKNAGLSLEEAAFRLHIAPRTLCKYEAGQVVPSPDVVLKMSQEYQQPELTLLYCRENCAIGKAYGYEVLDAVDTNPVVVLAKLMGEMEEALNMLNRAMSIAINKVRRGDFTNDEWDIFSEAVLEFLDVEHNIEVLKLVMGRMTDVAELVERHNQKCRENGYVKRKTAYKAAR